MKHVTLVRLDADTTGTVRVYFFQGRTSRVWFSLHRKMIEPVFSLVDIQNPIPADELVEAIEFVNGNEAG